MNTDNIRFSKDHSCVLDWVAWLQLAEKSGAFIFVNKKLVKHRIHVDSKLLTRYKMVNASRKSWKFFPASGVKI
ncbi:hypothetical protein [Niabella hibiscisoli]|uniref:hypothetical protein n=1 Tax=Niabella hibiscisoli TaxID=1825928 RepID=UPI001F0E86C5|nr:hypothetical protein [Niabella hibiscisoli]MCH5718082.1 hypothetical protein [Niabella hibiscisoli]